MLHDKNCNIKLDKYEFKCKCSDVNTVYYTGRYRS